MYGSQGLPAVCVNPWRARRFAEASGRRVKTDPIEATMLASMAAVIPLRLTAELPETRHRLQQLQQAREALVRDRVAASQRLERQRLPLLRR